MVTSMNSDGTATGGIIILKRSAALEVSVGYALADMSNVDVDLIELAKCCQQAENEFVGMRCGIMDQFISCRGTQAWASAERSRI